ncbi:hypothetical protein QJS04_geneDACA001504 [Acorus gramineus]|uniref:Symplekin C-terminal domain-containing protein n=1 Tax=Acorus gramineus TaxID=55184 RepID=A0AAV9BKF4_ACOGR|nr:hypothetical protein QJS04_geneDACA001504 [Acorus gramineus]
MLLKSLRSMNAGEAADQVLRQVDKMLKGTDRITRDARISRDDVSSIEGPVSGDPSGKKYIVQGSDGPTSMDESPPKRTRYNSDISLAQSAPLAIEDQDDATFNGFSSNVSLTDRDPTPAEQMIGMIGALLAEGERGAESLEILISKIQPDLMADIVIANMKHLPSTSLPLFSRLDNLPTTSQASSYALPQFMPPVSAPIPPPPTTHQVTSSVASGTGFGISTSDISPASNLLPDSKRDPRRDPRRLDPRRIAVPAEAQSAQITDDQSGLDGSLSGEVSLMAKSEGTTLSIPSKNNMEIPDNAVVPSPDSSLKKNGVLDEFKKIVPSAEVHAPSDLTLSPVHVPVQEQDASSSSDVTENEGADISMPDSDQYSSAVPSTSASEVVSHELPLLPPYVELMDEQKKLLGKLTVVRIIEAYEQIQAIGGSQLRLSLLSRLVAQTNNDDEIVVLLQKHIIPDYQHHKGHELAMEVLYHLHSVMVSKPDELSSSYAAKFYEKFLVEVAKSLCDSFPASDKSFSKLLSEVPLLPQSALKLLEDLCRSHGFGQHDKVTFDGDRVTQGLGTVWSLILGRPLDRQACLDIALKCTIDTQDEVRARAIRLVANKLYQVDYVSQMIEQFATDMLLSVVDQQTPDVELATGSSEQSTEVGSQETPIVGSQSSELGASESDPIKSAQPPSQNAATISLSQAHRHMSLYFALCAKKPDLLQLVFDIYGRAPKPVKQAVNRHIPILLRTLGSSYSELLRIISDPPPGSESLLMLVLQILTEMVPPANLVATVKHLYETKIKDAAILIPMLSLLSKDEVLPIFPQLVGLPLDKFQTALARILQGSAHTGPALTPAEVLVAIHEIHPEKDGVALKKVMDACTACFEQRTVFTQHVLEKSLNVLVEKMPLPLLLMRTVIQAIDAFPTLVDYVMGILSRLVSKQIWKMPKLWVGFLKCAYQTQPHSFPVLLQLPPPQLESALNKHPSLRGPLAAHANQPTVRTSLPRATLEVLGLGDESQQSSRSYIPSTSSSIHGTVLPL